MNIPDAVDALDGLTLAIVRHADDLKLEKLFQATHQWHLIAAAERFRRREAHIAVTPDRSALPQSQERP